jgi:hypothetical protein
VGCFLLGDSFSHLWEWRGLLLPRRTSRRLRHRLRKATIIVRLSLSLQYAFVPEVVIWYRTAALGLSRIYGGGPSMAYAAAPFQVLRPPRAANAYIAAAI